MRSIIILLSLCMASIAFAQDEDQSGFTFGAQAGFEYIDYTENYTNSKKEPAMLDGSSSAIVGTFSIEYDLSKKFKRAPFFVALSAGIPLVSFKGTEIGTFTRDGYYTFISQKEDVVHEYSMVRAFFGYKAKPEFSPFILFERALFQSTRSNMLEGTDSGILVPADTGITWKERVWSSHFGAGFQGGIPLNPAKDLSVRYRVAALLPLSSFVTNDHPKVYSQGQKLGRDASGFTILARVALQYDWHSRSSLQLGVNIYSRSWGGDGETTSNAAWPANVMEAIPVLLGVTWAI